MPESLWKALIDLEIIELDNLPAARALYRKLLDKSKHLKVWLSFAKFESNDANNVANARAVYEEGLAYFKEQGAKDGSMKEERLMLLESWLRMEQEKGGQADRVEARLPKRVKKRRRT